MQQMRLIITIAFLLIISIGDIKTKTVSLKISAIFLVLGILMQLWDYPGLAGEPSLTGILPEGTSISIFIPVMAGFYRVLTGLLPGTLALIIGYLTGWKLGAGDGIVIMIIGVLLGGRRTVGILLYALFICGIFGLGLVAIKKAGKNTTLPFVPFLTLGCLVSCIVQAGAF